MSRTGQQPMRGLLAVVLAMALLMPGAPGAGVSYAVANAPQPLHTVGIYAVSVGDDDGSLLPPTTPADVTGRVAEANAFYAPAGVQLSFNAADFETVHSTVLNRDFSYPADVTTYTDPDSPPPGDAAPHENARQAIALQHLGKVVIFFTYGSEPYFSDDQGHWVDEGRGGFSNHVDQYVAMPNNADGTRSTGLLLAHEMGHHLHLDHTFSASPATSAEAATMLGDAIEGLYQGPAPVPQSVIDEASQIFDGDVGDVWDTPADPGPTLWKEQNGDACTSATLVRIDAVVDGVGTVSVPFQPSRDNIMSYHDKECAEQNPHFTAQQIERIRYALEHGNRHHLISASPSLWQGPAPSVAAWGPGLLDVVALGSDGGAYFKSWDQGAGAWWPSFETNWASLYGRGIGQPEIVAWGPNRLDVFMAGIDGAVWHKAYDSGAWYPSEFGWESLGGSATGTPAVVSRGPGQLNIFVRGANGGVFHKGYDQGRWWPNPEPEGAWEPLGGEITDSPAVVSWGPQRLDLFARGTNGGVFHKAWDAGRWYPEEDPAGPWEDLGGEITGTPAVASWGSGRLDVVARGTNGGVFHKAWDTNRWYPEETPSGPWEDLGGEITDSPAAVSWGSGRLDVFARGTNGGVFHKAWDAGRWFPEENPNGPWEDLGGAIVGSPTVTSWGPGRLDIFVRGWEGGIWHKAWEGAWFPGDDNPLQWENLNHLLA